MGAACSGPTAVAVTRHSSKGTLGTFFEDPAMFVGTFSDNRSTHSAASSGSRSRLVEMQKKQSRPPPAVNRRRGPIPHFMIIRASLPDDEVESSITHTPAADRLEEFVLPETIVDVSSPDGSGTEIPVERPVVEAVENRDVSMTRGLRRNSSESRRLMMSTMTSSIMRRIGVSKTSTMSSSTGSSTNIRHSIPGRRFQRIENQHETESSMSGDEVQALASERKRKSGGLRRERLRRGWASQPAMAHSTSEIESKQERKRTGTIGSKHSKRLVMKEQPNGNGDGRSNKHEIEVKDDDCVFLSDDNFSDSGCDAIDKEAATITGDDTTTAKSIFLLMLTASVSSEPEMLQPVGKTSIETSSGNASDDSGHEQR